MSRALVIGGGLAGITAALDLADTGMDVTLLESRGRLGGAAYSFTRDGLSIDNGQHVFLRCCGSYRALVQRLGAGTRLHLQSRLSIPVLAPGGPGARLFRDGLPAPLHLTRSLLAYPYLSWPERSSVAWAMQALGRVDPDSPAADVTSFGAWLARHRQSANAVEVIWELIAKPTLNVSVEQASLAQAAYVFQQGLLASAEAGDIGWAQSPLGAIHDVAARAALERAGVQVRLRSGAIGLESDEAGFRVRLREETLDADAVVLAVGPARAVKLLPAEARVDAAAITALGSSPIVNLHVIYDRPVMDVAFAATVRSPVQWLFDRTATAGLDHGQYLAVSLSAADTELGQDPDTLAARFLPAIAAVLPAAGTARVENFFVTREHAATFRPAPGQRGRRPGAATALPGLALAGAWTDTGWPATMEGAVRSGHAAAAEIGRTLAQRPVPAEVLA